MHRRRLFASIVCAFVALSSLLIAPPAAAAPQTAEPAILTIGWWWKDAQSEEQDIQGNKFVVETTNPFCPTIPGSLGGVPGTCAEQRFPVEIRGGDYEEPNMLSGLGFDLSMLTPGSEVFKFTMTLLEAEAGCYDGPDEGDECTPGAAGAEGDHVEQTDPINIEGKTVKACLLTQIFGDAEARPYREVPTYGCPEDAPVAERKEIEAVDEGDADGVDHVWTFDLTQYAEEWAQEFTVTTNVMLVGNEPEEEAGGDDTWRVVFAGPRAKRGVKTVLRYEPAELEIPTFDDPTTTGGSSFTGGGSSFTTGTGSTSDFGGGAPATGGDAAPAPEASPSPGTDLGALASGEGPQVESMPAYMWLAILAGVIGFVMFRQVVVESTTGIRPDGVLAKIHALNAQRRGIDAEELAAEGGGALVGAANIFGALGHRLAGLKSKLPFGRK